MKKYQILTLLIFTLLACGKHNKTLDKLEQIKTVGDENPKLAITMLDSLTHAVREEDEYTQMKYDLLNIRLHDKNYDVATSDKDIKRVVKYFEEKGSDVEKQEAYHYAGSVYRDLKDTPRALEYFLKSTNVDNNNTIDSAILRNSYSNISYIYSTVQDYVNSIQTAKKELELCHLLNRSDIFALGHLSNGYAMMDSTIEAKKYLDKIVEQYLSVPIELQDSIVLYNLLHDCCNNRDTANALLAHKMLMDYCSFMKVEPNPFDIGVFYKDFSNRDSAIVEFKKVLNYNEKFEEKYDALKFLFLIYKEKHEYEKAAEYGKKFFMVCDTLDFGKRQELAATVKNQYNYHHDKEAEQLLKEENQDYKAKVRTITIISIAVFAIMIAVYVIIQNRQLRKLLKATNELQSTRTLNHDLQAQVQAQNNELKQARAELKQKMQELQSTHTELQMSKEELRQKDDELSKRIEQNEQLINLLHQAELEDKAEDIVQSIRLAAEGHKKISKKEEAMFINAVDELFPDFKNLLTSQMGTIKDEKLFAFYLMKAGFNNTQISHLTGTSTVNVWRWKNKYLDTLANKQ